MSLKKYITIIAFVFSNLIFSQKYELGKVTIEELNEKKHPVDSSAPAKIMFEKGKTFFEYNKDDGFKLITEVEVKIKIYKKEGYDWANKQIPFYVGGTNNERVDISKAVTYNLVNGAVEKSKLKSDGEFIDKSNKFWSLKKIAMPNVKEGSIIEYKYTINSPFLSSFPEWNFQSSIPIDFSEYTTQIPEYFTYNVHRKGFLTPKEVKINESRTIHVLKRELSTTNRRDGIYQTNDYESTFVETKTVYMLANIPAIVQEDFVNNTNNYLTSVQHELSSKQMSISDHELFATTWEDVVKTIYEDESFGNQLNKNNYFEEDVNTLIQGLTTNEEKVQTIFAFVQSKMNWDKYLDYRCDKGVKKAYQDKTGNSAEINLMLVAMLRFIGLDANPVLVSTRANGIALYPSRTAYNNVIAAVNLENGMVLLDATNKNATPTTLPFRDLNWFGRLIRKDKTSELIDLMPKKPSKKTVNMLIELDGQGTISGDLREQHFDYNGLAFRDNYSGLSNDAYLSVLESKHKGVDISKYEVTNATVLNEPIIEKYAIKSSSCVDVIDNKMYFSPLLYLAKNSNPFKQETRDYPIDFKFPNQEKNQISITIPDGYSVESIPKSRAINMSDNLASYKYQVTNTDKKIQLLEILEINTSIFSSEYYEELKAFYAEIIKTENEKISLKKNN